MITTYRLSSFVAPKVEERLLAYDVTEEVIDFFFKSHSFFSKVVHVATFVIPLEFRSLFFSVPKLKILMESLDNDPQSNVLFGRVDNLHSCTSSPEKLNAMFPGFEFSLLSKKLIINTLSKKKYPFLMDTNSYDILKNDCSACTDSNVTCKPEFTIPISTIPEDHLCELIESLLMKNISHWHVDLQNLNENDLKLLAFLVSILNQVEVEYIYLLNSFTIHPGFLRDIKSCPGRELSDIAFSMFRAIAFPPISSKERHIFSIDCHRNDPFKCEGCELFRVDVMPPSKSGNSSSGVERILLANKDGEKYFVSYTSTHEFVMKTVKERLAELS